VEEELGDVLMCKTLFCLLFVTIPQSDFHVCKEDPRLIKSIIQVESRGYARAVSRSAGAVGLMQVMPKSFRRFCKHRDPVCSALLLYPQLNRAEGCRILWRWKRRSRGNLRRALQAYNCGNRGLRDECGVGYANNVLRRVRRFYE